MSPREKELARIIQNLVDNGQWLVSAIELDHNQPSAEELLKGAKAALAMKVRRPLSMFNRNVLVALGHIRGTSGVSAHAVKLYLGLDKHSTGRVDKALRQLSILGYAQQSSVNKLWSRTDAGDASLKERT